MKPLILIGVYVFCNLPFFVLGQNYHVSFSTQYYYSSDVSGIEYVRYRLKTSSETYDINGEGVILVDSAPTTIIIISYLLNVDEYGNEISTCGPIEQEVSLSFDNCISEVNDRFRTTCSGPVYFAINARPVLEYNSGTTLSGSKMCLSDPIRLVASPGFSSYTWRAQTTNGYHVFDPGPGNDVSFTLDSIFGDGALEYVNETVFFEYLVGNCSDFNTAPRNEYKLSIPPPNIENYTLSEPTCNGFVNASITGVQLDRDLLLSKNEAVSFYLQYSEGNDPGNSLDGNYFNLRAGSYTLSLQSEQIEYCTTDIPGVEIIIGEPEPLDFTVSNQIPVACFGTATGSITLEPTGGQGSDYEFSVNNSNFSSSSTISNLTAGEHSITIKDGNNCTATASLTVVGPNNQISANAIITSDYNGSPVSCPFSSDGSIKIVASGGWGNYLFSESENGTFSLNNNFENLQAGTHTFWIMDNAGCKVSETILIVPPVALDASVIQNMPSCPSNYGTIEAVATGGTGLIEYSIDDINYQLSNKFDVLSGNYTLYLRDQNGCKYLVQNILIDNPLSISFDTQITKPTCQSSQDASLEIINIINGQSPYMYSIDGGATYQNGTVFSNMSAGIYNVVVKDSKNCIISSIKEVIDPQPINGQFSPNAITCFGDNNGTLTIIPEGGTPGYSYLWSTGAITKEITNLKAGQYSVIITDSNTCHSNELFYTLNQPSNILVDILYSSYNGFNVSCSEGNDGSVEALVSGGTIAADYQYEWSNGFTERSVFNLTEGLYSIAVTDDNGCISTAEIEMVGPPALDFTEFAVLEPDCFGAQNGSITIGLEGGNGSYMYSINNSPLQASHSFNNLQSGVYEILAIDENGCSVDSIVTINQPDEVIINSVEIINTSCSENNGSIIIEAKGGTGSYDFSWTSDNGQIIGNEPIIENLLSGQYTISITDQNGCNYITSYALSNSDGPNITIENITGITCSTTSDGSASIIISGGSPPYRVIWDNGVESQNATNLSAGVHEVSVEDSNACKTFLSIEIPDINPIEISIVDLYEPRCSGNSDGHINILATGGVPPYSYSWDHGSNENYIQNLVSSEYKVTVTDSNNCLLENTISLREPQPVVLEYSILNPTCKEAQDGEISLFPSGGTPPYRIFYNSDSISSRKIKNISPGTYTFEIFDSKDCNTITEVIIDNSEPEPIFLEDIVICSGQQISVSSPVKGVRYLWSNEDELISTDSIVSIGKEGSYSLEVQSIAGCTVSGKFNVSTSNDILNTEFLLSSNANVGDTVIVIDITYPIPDSINWIVPNEAELISFNKDFAILVFNEPGTYSVSIESFLGLCYDVESTEIEIHALREGNVSGRIPDNTTQLLNSSVYPNPNYGKFRVEAFLNRSDVVKIIMIDLISKQTVFQSEHEGLDIYNEYNLTDVKSGPYAIVIQAVNKVNVHRIIIQ